MVLITFHAQHNDPPRTLLKILSLPFNAFFLLLANPGRPPPPAYGLGQCQRFQRGTVSHVRKWETAAVIRLVRRGGGDENTRFVLRYRLVYQR